MDEQALMDEQNQKDLRYLEQFIRNNLVCINTSLNKINIYLENLDRARGAIQGLIEKENESGGQITDGQA